MKRRTIRRVRAASMATSSVRWSVRHVLPFLVTGAVAGLVHVGAVVATPGGIAVTAGSIAVLIALLIREVLVGRREGRTGALLVLSELRMLVPGAGVLALVTQMAQVYGLDLGALDYLFALVTVTFFTRGASLPAIVVIMLMGWIAGGGPEPGTSDMNGRLASSLFLTFFSGFGLAFLRTEIVRLRARGKERIEARLNRITELARDYRLMSAPSSEPTGTGEEHEREDEEEQKRRALQSVTASLHEIHSTLYTLLDVVQRTMHLHTCVLLWKDDAGEYLKILEAASESAAITESPIPAQYGVTGVVVTHGKPISFCPFPTKSTPLPYYTGAEEVQSFVALPVFEDKAVRGVLCADRLTQDAFSDRDVEALESVVEQAVRVINNERVFLQLAKSKTEQSRLYHASTRLRIAHSCDEVLAAAFESQRSIVDWEMAAATSYDPATRRHTVLKAEGLWTERLDGLTFKENDGLVSQTVRMRYYLPYKGRYDPASMSVMTRRVRFKGARSLLVLPLVVRDRAIGTMVLASRRDNVFNLQIRPLLQVIADQTALSYHNALMVRRLEEMATTDGLTGLHNKRIFLEALSRKLLAAERFGKRLSLVMTDLDKFKSVNDTHGHQVGDEVLKRFAAVLERNAREVDMACRYGGEEFAIICEETDAEGAYMLAERIRTDMQGESFTSTHGPFRVTCSLGVATGPCDGVDAEELIRTADEALYEAKRGGRNRVVTASQDLLKTG